MTKPIFLALGLAALPAVAGAADIPGNATTQTRIPYSNNHTVGAWETRNDSDWYRIDLEAGREYAASLGYAGGRITLRDARGRVLASAEARRQGPFTETGFEYRPAMSGTYYLEAKQFGTLASEYRVRIGSDCRRDRTTKCTVKVGQSQARSLNWPGDVDLLKVNLDPSRTYTLEVFTFNPVSLKLLDAEGQVIATGETFACYDSSDNCRRFNKLRVAKPGAYFVRVAATPGEDAGFFYTLNFNTP